MANIEYVVSEKVATIRINREGSLNALNVSSLDEFSSIWQTFAKDPNAWVGILTSSGNKAFCVGMDLKEKQNHDEGHDLVEKTIKISPREHQIDKPIICAIKGYCFGLGWWLCMECDLRIASSDAQLGIPENRLNISPIFGGLIGEHIPPAIGLELLFTGESLKAQRAFELGFINRVVENAQDVEKESLRLARRICKNGPLSVRRSKELYYQSLEMNRRGSLSLAESYHRELRVMDDSKEARLAFQEKRQPQWQEK